MTDENFGRFLQSPTLEAQAPKPILTIVEKRAARGSKYG